jgi:hypothetical protein
LDPSLRSISVDRRRVVPGELRHFQLEPAVLETDIVDVVRGWFRKGPKARIEPQALTTSTWGIDCGHGAVGWPAITSLAYRQVRRAGDDHNPLMSELDVELSDAVWRGECALEPLLDVLVEVFPLFAEEARREVALGFSAGGPSEPARAGLFVELLRNAREWLASPEGAEETQVVSGEYRTQERRLRPTFTTELELALAGAPIAADRGPFAAIVAAELRVTSLLDHLRTLTTSPHPLLAAIAAGAALRLGESPIRVGKPEHVEPYIDAETSRAIMAWAAGA